MVLSLSASAENVYRKVKMLSDDQNHKFLIISSDGNPQLYSTEIITYHQKNIQTIILNNEDFNRLLKEFEIL